MWEIIESNKRKSLWILIFMFIIFILTGFCVGMGVYCGLFLLSEGDFQFSYPALLNFSFWGCGIFIIVWYCMISWMSSQGEIFILEKTSAKSINSKRFKFFHNIVEEMCIASGLGIKPQLLIIDSTLPNAFAVGQTPEKAKIAVTTKLVEILNRDELQAVIAHEIAHIRNYDSRLLTRAFIMLFLVLKVSGRLNDGNNDDGVYVRPRYSGSSGGGGGSSDKKGAGAAVVLLLIALIFVFVVAPLVLKMLYSMLSIKREYLADACAVQYTRYPASLASALNKINDYYTNMTFKETAFALPIFNSTSTTEKMLFDPLLIFPQSLYLLDGKGFPIRKEKGQTHPPIEERIKVLEKMNGSGLADYRLAYQSVTGKNVLKDKGLESQPIIKPKEDENDKLVNDYFIKSIVQGITSAGLAVQTDVNKELGDELEKRRWVTDVCAEIHNYAIIECDCDTTLKIPPFYAGKVIQCPHCLKEHKVEVEVT